MVADRIILRFAFFVFVLCIAIENCGAVAKISQIDAPRDGGYTWGDAKSACEANELRLCQAVDLCSDSLFEDIKTEQWSHVHFRLVS